MLLQVDRDLYTRISESAAKNQVSKSTIPIKTGMPFEVLAGQTIRVIAAHGPQVTEHCILSFEIDKVFLLATL